MQEVSVFGASAARHDWTLKLFIGKRFFVGIVIPFLSVDLFNLPAVRIERMESGVWRWSTEDRSMSLFADKDEALLHFLTVHGFKEEE